MYSYFLINYVPFSSIVTEGDFFWFDSIVGFLFFCFFLSWLVWWLVGWSLVGLVFVRLLAAPMLAVPSLDVPLLDVLLIVDLVIGWFGGWLVWCSVGRLRDLFVCWFD